MRSQSFQYIYILHAEQVGNLVAGLQQPSEVVGERQAGATQHAADDVDEPVHVLPKNVILASVQIHGLPQRALDDRDPVQVGGLIDLTGNFRHGRRWVDESMFEAELAQVGELGLGGYGSMPQEVLELLDGGRLRANHELHQAGSAALSLIALSK